MANLTNSGISRWLAFGAVVIFLFGFASGCETGDGEGDGTAHGLVKCANCDELQQWLIKVAVHQMKMQIDANRGWGGDYSDGVPNSGDDDMAGADDDDDGWDDDDDAVSDDDDDGAPEDDSSQGGDDDDDSEHSDTNVQEQGVDEADIIKTDGSILYLLSGGYLMLFDPDPAPQTSELSRLDITGTPLEMFTYQDIVLVFSQHTPYNLPADIWPNVPQEELAHNILKLTVVDVSDTSNPILIREAYMEGSYISSRRIDASSRIVIFSEPNGPDVDTWVDTDEFCDWEEYPYECDEEAIQDAYDELLEDNLDEIAGRPLENWLPRYHEVIYDSSGQPSHFDELFANCDNNYHPQSPRGYGFLTVMTVMMDNPATKQPDIAVIAERGEVYSSSYNLIVAENQDTMWDWAWEEIDQGVTPMAEVHMFDIQANPNQASYVASGAIEGFVLNQFSMSEYQGYLRMAATSGWWQEPFINTVYVLERNSDELTLAGSVDLTVVADREEIKSARFMGDKGYVVTFENTDPLYTLDLSDPYNPLEVGFLEIPGFSSYIHPMDDDHLLTIGETGDQWGSTGGVALQIFDVSNLSNPQLIHSYDIGEYWDGYSEAQYNHKAFLYYHHNNLNIDLLVFPLTYYGYGGYDDDDWDDDDDVWDDDDDAVPGSETFGIDTDFGITEQFSGFLAFNCNAVVGFNDPLFAAEHTDFVPENASEWYGWLPYPLRSAVIGDYLFTLSDVALLVTDLGTYQDYTPISLPWEDPWDDYWGDDDDWGMEDDGAEVPPTDS